VVPGIVTEGDTVNVDGIDFSDGGTVTIEIREMLGGEPQLLRENVPTENGEFSEEISLEGIEPGRYQILVTDNETDRVIRESLLINAASWNGSIEIAPATITIGESTTVYGAGYTPGETATVVLEPRFDGGDSVVLDSVITINDDGSFEYALDTSAIGDDLQEGNYQVSIIDDSTDNS